MWQVFVQVLREIEAQYFSWQLPLLYTWTVPCDGWQARRSVQVTPTSGTWAAIFVRSNNYPFLIVDAQTRIGFASWLGGILDVRVDSLMFRRRFFVLSRGSWPHTLSFQAVNFSRNCYLAWQHPVIEMLLFARSVFYDFSMCCVLPGDVSVSAWWECQNFVF